MLRSLFASISGLRAHQTMMDVTANNIANVNTQGFKSGRAVFADALAQTVRGGGIPTDGEGSTNPMQIGLGSRVAAVNTQFTQGSLQLTGRTTDLAIQGDGFFVVQRGDVQLLTRDGAFNWDANGQLVTRAAPRSSGGRPTTPPGVINPTDTPGTLSVPDRCAAPDARPRRSPSAATSRPVPPSATRRSRTATVYNTQGTPFDLRITFEKTATATWDATMGAVAGRASRPTSRPTHSDHQLRCQWPARQRPAEIDITGVMLGDGDPQDVTVSLGSALHAFTQYDQATTMDVPVRDGAAGAELFQVSFGIDGSITAQYTNGDSRVVGMVAVANVTNPEGMQKMADNLYAPPSPRVTPRSAWPARASTGPSPPARSRARTSTSPRNSPTWCSPSVVSRPTPA